MKIFPLTIYVLLKPFIQILPSDSKKSLWDSRTTATFSSNDHMIRPILFSKMPTNKCESRQLVHYKSLSGNTLQPARLLPWPSADMAVQRLLLVQLQQQRSAQTLIWYCCLGRRGKR
jgi:hypothetical protein